MKTLLITNPIDIYYLSKFEGSNGFLIINDKKTYLFTDPRYRNTAKSLEHKSLKSVIYSKIEDLEKFANKHKFETIHFQTDIEYRKYLMFKRIFKKSKFRQIKDLIHNRHIKTSQEIQALRQAQTVNEKILHSVRKSFKVGVTELEIANMIKIEALKHGAQKLSFEPIVGFGKNSANIHHHPTINKLKAGDVILIDMGVEINKYQSDMSRTFLPKNASKQLLTDYQKVLDAHMHGIKQSKIGMKISQLDKEARKFLSPDNFEHSLGHGIGIEVHEQPFMNPNSQNKLKENMAITIEPGLYKKDYGIRIEDVVIVGKQKGQSINNFPKDISDMIWV